VQEQNESRPTQRAWSPRARLVAVGVVGALIGAATIGGIWAATDDDGEPGADPAPTSPADEPTIEATQPPPDTVVPATAAQPAVDETSPAVEPTPATDAPAEAAQPAPADPAPTAPPLDLTPTAFVEPFDGEPAAAEPWNPEGWDVTVHSRGANTWSTLERMDAGHGPGCEPPPSTHTVSAYEDMVFQCRNHMMTSLNTSEYGLIYVTPDHMVDFSGGEAVIQVDVSTLRGGLRDWWDIWITPFDANVQLTLDEDLPDLGGFPSEAIHIRQDNFDGKTVFIGEIISDFERIQLENDWALLDDFLVPDAARRDKFELRISANHIRFGMPAYDVWWIDADIADLGWTSGVVQIGHHSYTPDKDCYDGPCGPNTWHWDNVVIDPAIPFTMIKADQRAVTATGTAVNFPTAAPEGAFLRFAGHGTDIEIKAGGGEWEDAVVQESSDPSTEGFKSFWTPIPEGTTSVTFRGKELNNAPFHVRDIAIWSAEGP
jgi:hypothetical protein